MAGDARREGSGAAFTLLNTPTPFHCNVCVEKAVREKRAGFRRLHDDSLFWNKKITSRKFYTHSFLV